MRGVRRNAVWIRSSVIYGVEILQHRKLHSGCQKAVINPPAATLGPGPWWVALPSLCTPAFSCCLSACLLCTSHYSRMRPGVCLRGAQLDWERAERWPKRAIEAMNKMPQGEERRSLSSSSRPCPWSLVTIQCVGAPLRPWPHSSSFRLLPSAPLKSHTALQLSTSTARSDLCDVRLHTASRYLILFETSSFHVSNSVVSSSPRWASNSPLVQEAQSPIRWLLCSLVKHDFCWLHSILVWWSRTETPEIDPQICGWLIFVKGEKVK